MLKTKSSKNIKLCLALSALITIYGCSSVSYTGAPQAVREINFPPIGAIAEAGLGEPMLRKGQSAEEDYLRLNQGTGGVLWSLEAGDFRQIGETSERKYFSPGNRVRHNMSGGGFPEALSISEQERQICVHVIMGKTHCYPADFSIVKKSIEAEANFQKTLFYNGRVGDRINIAYREFSGNHARPAFNNQVEYDLTASNEIGYMGAIIGKV